MNQYPARLPFTFTIHHAATYSISIDRKDGGNGWANFGSRAIPPGAPTQENLQQRYLPVQPLPHQKPGHTPPPCDDCKYTLHEGCSALPDALPPGFFAHRHPLHLTPKPGLLSFPKCFFCGHTIRGASFKCNECDVFLHPLCTRVKEVLPAHDIHPIHELRLEERSASGKCDACGEKCKKWRYYCGACEVHVHVECLAMGIDKVRAIQAAKKKQIVQLVGVIGKIGGLDFASGSSEFDS